MKKLVFIDYDKILRMGPGMGLCVNCCRRVFWMQDSSGICPYCRDWPGVMEAQEVSEFKSPEKILRRQKHGKKKIVRKISVKPTFPTDIVRCDQRDHYFCINVF